MIYGLYLSAQGADIQSTRMDVVSNNIANASTNSFKRDLAIFQEHPPFDIENGTPDQLPAPLNESTGGISTAEVATDFSQGSLRDTGGKFDVALSGPGFLKVTDGEQEFLTRNGKLTINRRGELVTHETGLNVLSAGGSPIFVSPEAQDVEVSTDGTITELHEGNVRSPIGRFEVVHPESLQQLQKQGDSLYLNPGREFPAGREVQVLQGHLESSGTQPTSEMRDLISASRAFEANINMIKYQEQALGRLLQSVARR